MKKLFQKIFLIMAVIVLFSSCGKEPPVEETQVPDIYDIPAQSEAVKE